MEGSSLQLNSNLKSKNNGNEKITLWQKQHLTIVSENAHFWMIKLVIDSMFINTIFTHVQSK